MDRRSASEHLLAFSDAILANSQALALCDSLDMGKPVSAAAGEGFPAAGFIRYYAEAIDKVYAGNVAPTGPGAMELQLFKPRGVVGAITPWNFPLINACLKLGPALAAGNTVVIKPSELSPRSSLLLARIASEAGLPARRHQCPARRRRDRCHAGGPSRVWICSPSPDRLPPARQFCRPWVESTLKPVLLECGGKSPEILFDDVAQLDLDQVAAQIVRGALWNQGQVCVARTRLLVHRNLYEDMLAAVLAVAETINPGDPLDSATSFGPLASARQKDIVEAVYSKWHR